MILAFCEVRDKSWFAVCSCAATAEALLYLSNVFSAICVEPALSECWFGSVSCCYHREYQPSDRLVTLWARSYSNRVDRANRASRRFRPRTRPILYPSNNSPDQSIADITRSSVEPYERIWPARATIGFHRRSSYDALKLEVAL